MSSYSHHDGTPWWSWVLPVVGAVLVGLKLAGIVPELGIVIAAAALLLGAAVFAAVHHAEILALKLGEPFGAILLAVAVTIIEVGLIASIMLAGTAGSENVARDTVFSAVMIVLNGVIGFCLVMGGRRHHEQSFHLDAASASLAVLGTLAILTLVLPNFVAGGGPQSYSSLQLVFVGAVCLLLYLTFLFVQTVRHRDYFLDEPDDSEGEASVAHPVPARVALMSWLLLPLSLTVVILLAKVLSKPLDAAVAGAGLPQAFVGVVIALIVLLPEGIASVKAAIRNRLQNSVNLALGSALASIGLTIPIIGAIALFIGSGLNLGLNPAHTALLLLTLFVSTITLGTGRTTIMQGAVHLAIFAVFLFLSAVP